MSAVTSSQQSHTIKYKWVQIEMTSQRSWLTRQLERQHTELCSNMVLYWNDWFSQMTVLLCICQLFQPLHTPVTAVGSCLIYPCVSYQQSTKSSEPRCQIFTVFCCCDKSAIPLTSFWLNLKVPAMTAALERSLLMVPLRFELSFRNYLLGECSALLQKGFTDII